MIKFDKALRINLSYEQLAEEQHKYCATQEGNGEPKAVPQTSAEK